MADKREELSQDQVDVLALLLAGQKQVDAAASVGVAAETVSRWVRHDAVFMAELNRRRLDAWEAQAARLAGLSGQAVDTIAELLASGSEASKFKAAVAILKGQGLNEVGPPEGEIDAEAIEKEWRTSTAWGSMVEDLVHR